MKRMTATTGMTLKQEVDAFLERHSDLAQVELLASDLSGNFFSKWYTRDQLSDFADNGLSIPRAMYVLSGTSESMPEAVGMGDDDGDPDMPVDIAPGTLSVVDWGERPRAQGLLHSRPTDIVIDPRRVLASVIDRYKDKGLYPVVAFELE
ncbi:MAG: glutamine synthetase, partial [Pseudomonadota bacterium]